MKYLKSFENFSKNRTKYDCEGNNLTILPELPDTVVILRCSNNKLKELPKLPIKLTSLTCRHNQLENLPELPNTIDYLSCSYNNLTELPKLPDSLLLMSCEDNKLQYLPILPDSLMRLHIDNNDWKEPIKHQYIVRFNEDLKDFKSVYTEEQTELFSSFNFQKEFLEKNPSRYEDFIPFGYADGIKELFPQIFSAHDLGL